jgi:glycolate oxidase FAD binding subunit
MTAGDRSSARQAMERVMGSDRVSDAVADHRIADATPAVVVFPESVEELALLMAEANESGLAVAPWGGGTRTDLGNAISRLDVVADLSKLDSLIEHNPADLTCTVQAGIQVAALQGVLAKQGQFLAVDPPLPGRATIGGTLATGVTGPLKSQFDHPRDLVIGMKVVQADGNLVKSGGQVVKNVTGYDMARLHIGGLGTLGVIAEVSFKLTPLPAGETTVVATFATGREALDAGLGIMRSHILPLALTALDSEVNAKADVVTASDSYILAVRLGGRPMTLKRMVAETSELARESGANTVETLDDAAAKTLWRRIADFGWDDHPAPVMAARASVLPSRVPELIESIDRSAASSDLRTAVVSHPGFGSVLIFWFAEDEGPSDDACLDALSRARDASHAAEGRMVVDRCPSGVKSQLDVWDEVGEPESIMRQMKAQYDPKGTLNPGRFVGGI